MTTVDLVNKASELLDKYELLDKGWYFEFDNAKRRFGCCNYTHKKISMSKRLVLNNLNNEGQLMDTLLHELAHAIAYYRYGGCQSHNDNWKKICVEIGAKPQRCYTSENINVVVGKYKYVCSHCGNVSYAHKRLHRTCACGDCCRKYNNGRFDKRYIINLVA